MSRHIHFLKTIKASQSPRLFMLLFALVMLGEHLVPYMDSADMDAKEVSENQEESESEEKSQREGDIEDADEWLHQMEAHSFAEQLILKNIHPDFYSKSNVFSTSDTPPPELG